VGLASFKAVRAAPKLKLRQAERRDNSDKQGSDRHNGPKKYPKSHPRSDFDISLRANFVVRKINIVLARPSIGISTRAICVIGRTPIVDSIWRLDRLLIVTLIIAGSLWIMDHLNHNMLPMHQMVQMQR
jgi:hypothetical protein